MDEVSNPDVTFPSAGPASEPGSQAGRPPFASLASEWRSAPAPAPAREEARAGPSASRTDAPSTPSQQVYDDDEISPILVRIAEGDDLASAARRAGAGLALTLPFALAVGLRTDAAPVDAIVGALALPVGLAVIALVGVSASTLGISLASAPLAPTTAASIASRGIFRAGLLLGGLAPLCALWVASARGLEALLCASLAVFVAGVSGIATIARGLVTATLAPDESARLGALVVSVLFVMFALVVGLRVWLPVVDVLTASPFGGGL